MQRPGRGTKWGPELASGAGRDLTVVSPARPALGFSGDGDPRLASLPGSGSGRPELLSTHTGSLSWERKSKSSTPLPQKTEEIKPRARRTSPSREWRPGETQGAATALADGSPKILVLHVRLMFPEGRAQELGAEPPGTCRSRASNKDTLVPT